MQILRGDGTALHEHELIETIEHKSALRFLTVHLSEIQVQWCQYYVDLQYTDRDLDFGFTLTDVLGF